MRLFTDECYLYGAFASTGCLAAGYSGGYFQYPENMYGDKMHFNNLFWGAWCVWAVVCLTYFAYRGNERRKRGPLFPVRGTVPVLYQENFASGRSFKNILTRHGGARSCLMLIVTPDELWVTTYFPFTLFAEFYDVEHRILKKNIVSLREKKNLFGGRSMIIAYTSEVGRSSEIELTPKRYDRFRQVLEINTLVF